MEYISCHLALMNIACQSTYSDTEQVDREQALEDLKTGAVQILLTTNEIRGMDMKSITHILNYDFPNMTKYFHRVDHIGCANRKGKSIIFLTRMDTRWPIIEDLIDFLRMTNQEISEELIQICE